MISLNNVNGNHMEMRRFNYMLEIDIFRNTSQKDMGVLGVVFKGLGVQKDTQTPCWLRPCIALLRPLDHQGRILMTVTYVI